MNLCVNPTEVHGTISGRPRQGLDGVPLLEGQSPRVGCRTGGVFVAYDFLLVYLCWLQVCVELYQEHHAKEKAALALVASTAPITASGKVTHTHHTQTHTNSHSHTQNLKGNAAKQFFKKQGRTVQEEVADPSGPETREEVVEEEHEEVEDEGEEEGDEQDLKKQKK